MGRQGCTDRSAQQPFPARLPGWAAFLFCLAALPGTGTREALQEELLCSWAVGLCCCLTCRGFKVLRRWLSLSWNHQEWKLIQGLGFSMICFPFQGCLQAVRALPLCPRALGWVLTPSQWPWPPGSLLSAQTASCKSNCNQPSLQELLQPFYY